MRAQSAVEFLTTYSWAFFVIGIFVVGTLALIFIPSKGTPTYAPESCYIQPSLPCFQAVVLTNSTSSKFLVVLQNNLGVKMYFPQNSLTMTPNYNGGTSYVGSCLPQNAISGSTVICNATLTGYISSTGSQLNPRFAINYQLCTPGCSNTIYNTTGTAIVISTPYKSVIFKISLSSDTAGGQIAVGGTRYASAANVIFIAGLNYQLYAVPPSSAYTFNGWVVSSNITLTGGLQSTTASALGPGSIRATFH